MLPDAKLCESKEKVKILVNVTASIMSFFSSNFFSGAKANGLFLARPATPEMSLVKIFRNGSAI